MSTPDPGSSTGSSGSGSSMSPPVTSAPALASTAPPPSAPATVIVATPESIAAAVSPSGTYLLPVKRARTSQHGLNCQYSLQGNRRSSAKAAKLAAAAAGASVPSEASTAPAAVPATRASDPGHAQSGPAPAVPVAAAAPDPHAPGHAAGGPCKSRGCGRKRDSVPVHPHIAQQQHPYARPDGSAADPVGSASSATAAVCPNTATAPAAAVPAASGACQLSNASGGHSFSPGAATAPSTSAPARQATAADIDDISNNMMLIVTLDEDGNAKSYSNLGHSNGMYLLQKWSKSLSEGVVYQQSFYEQRVPARELLREQALFPTRAFAELMLNVYFDTKHRSLPFLDRAEIFAELDKPSPNYFLLNAALACGCMGFEFIRGLNVLNSRMLLSRLFAERAKARLFRLVSAHVHSVESVQATMLLVCHALNVPGHSPWVLLGMAVSIAIDLGLHLDLRAAQFRKVQLCLPTISKTWAFVFATDRLVSMSMGRPLMIHDEDAFLNFDTFLATPENLAEYPAEILVAPDDYFVWSVKLLDIGGKIIRSLNSIEQRRRLQYSMVELHALLTRYRAELPPKFQFCPAVRDVNLRTQAASLNLRYYTLIIALYRPLVSAKSTVIESPLKQQYLSLLEGSLVAMIQILTHIREHMVLYPFTPGHETLTMLSVCVLLVANDTSPTRAVARNVLGYLARIHEIVVAASVTWPVLTHLLRAVVEIQASVRGVVQDFTPIDAHVVWVMSRVDQASEAVHDLLDSSVVEQQARQARIAEWYTQLADTHASDTASASATTAALASAAVATVAGLTNGVQPVNGALLGSSAATQYAQHQQQQHYAAPHTQSYPAAAPTPAPASYSAWPTSSVPAAPAPAPVVYANAAPAPAPAAAATAAPSADVMMAPLPTFPEPFAAHHLGTILDWSSSDDELTAAGLGFAQLPPDPAAFFGDTSALAVIQQQQSVAAGQPHYQHHQQHQQQSHQQQHQQFAQGGGGITQQAMRELEELLAGNGTDDLFAGDSGLSAQGGQDGEAMEM
ncbi:hypothetical protein H9P43_000112 [Blastocladiella emersonii ATCC 22665]|nr:hypothetical protein H9P43_000112 [Blastocladiella emersonii ATCC 22665]